MPGHAESHHYWLLDNMGRTTYGSYGPEDEALIAASADKAAL
ncbi:hypothetical protein L538_2677 [Bordetella hinzii 4161]|nr:hypothetical protein L538_2677 [Bordetella hinzii 4161]